MFQSWLTFYLEEPMQVLEIQQQKQKLMAIVTQNMRSIRLSESILLYFS